MKIRMFRNNRILEKKTCPAVEKGSVARRNETFHRSVQNKYVRMKGRSDNAANDPLSTAGGFTLIELMIVITIIGILLSVAAPRYKSATITAGEAALKKDLFILRDVIDQYYADHGKYPPALNSLVEAGYVRGIPKDPFTQSADSWVEVQAEGEDGGIYDVHSGSDLVGLDGTPYNIW